MSVLILSTPNTDATGGLLRLGIWDEELVWRRDLLGDVATLEGGIIHQVYGQGEATISIPMSHELAQEERWYRTLVVLYHPHLPPLPLTVVAPWDQRNDRLTLRCADASYYTEVRVLAIPNERVSTRELKKLIKERLIRPPATPIRHVRWQAGRHEVDLSGIYRPEGVAVKDVLDLLASQYGMLWWVSWNNDKAQCELNLRDADVAEPVGRLSLPMMSDVPETRVDLSRVTNALRVAIYNGRQFGREVITLEHRPSIRRYGYRERAYEMSGWNDNPSLLLVRDKRPGREMSLPMRTEYLKGIYLGDTVWVDLPKRRYRVVVEGIGVESSLLSAVVVPHVAELD